MNLGKHLGAIPAQDNKQFVMCVVLGRSGNSKENLFLCFSRNKLYYDILTRQQYKMQTANFSLDTKCRLQTIGTKWRLGITTGFCQIHDNMSFCNLHGTVTQSSFSGQSSMKFSSYVSRYILFLSRQ